MAAAAYEYGLVKLWAKAPETSEGEEGEYDDDREHFTAASLAPDGIPHDLTTSIPQLRPYLSLQARSDTRQGIMVWEHKRGLNPNAPQQPPQPSGGAAAWRL